MERFVLAAVLLVIIMVIQNHSDMSVVACIWRISWPFRVQGCWSLCRFNDRYLVILCAPSRMDLPGAENAA
jgi:hypothetical protein